MELYPAGNQIIPDGTVVDLPPILFGTLGEDKKKNTLLIYGHLDVQPAQKSDGWDTEPFKLVEKVSQPYCTFCWRTFIYLAGENAL